ncbi:MAG TPA: type IV secretion system protein [Novosphingobium sp.]|nr:type IV secretion system protein [Novosphingobium sp.]
MACGAVFTGQRFVAETLMHIDCQAQSVGAYGYGALANSTSVASIALTGLLTIFVALFGFRLLTGEPMSGRDVIGDVLKLGIVLTLATSWPAWRTLGYDLVMQGPVEVAATVGAASGLAGTNRDMVGRMQNADDGIVALTIYGTGRNTGGTNRSDAIGDSFRGIALADQEGLANGRIVFLAGLIGPLAIVRLGAGFLLAIAPLMAGLLLFAGTRDLFFGWLRGLGAAALASLALALVYGVELAVLEPWLNDALSQRSAMVLTPSAPTELVVITLAFALTSFGMLALIAKIAFFGGMRLPKFAFPNGGGREASPLPQSRQLAFAGNQEPPSRAFVVAEAVAQTLRREDRTSDRTRLIEQTSLTRGSMAQSAAASATTSPQEALGSSYRSSEARRYRRSSASAGRRDDKT